MDYDGPVITETADIAMVKVFINGTMSTPEAKFCHFDIKSICLGITMKECKCIRLHINITPEEIIQKCKLQCKMDKNGWACVEIRRAMCGLKPAGRISHDQLKDRLTVHRHKPPRIATGLWKHETKPVQFSLIVDDVRVKCVGKENAEHLRDILKQH